MDEDAGFVCMKIRYAIKAENQAQNGKTQMIFDGNAASDSYPTKKAGPGVSPDPQSKRIEFGVRRQFIT